MDDAAIHRVSEERGQVVCYWFTEDRYWLSPRDDKLRERIGRTM